MTYYFYDLETTGFNPREQRVMQFAGQRTDMDLNPVGDPHNFLLKLSDDVLPDPYAILITGITPQKSIAEGINEAEFLKLFNEEIALADTVFVGYNTVRFDDEFMRYLHYRNFYDPYEWQWAEGRSKWDLLDMIRMMRALRPEGMQWPFDAKGKPSNRLELLTGLNKIEHSHAHDALSDVRACIDLAKLIRRNQPKLFDFLFSMRTKQAVAKLALGGKPFLYTSGKYNSDYEKTTVVATVAPHPSRDAAYVYDLRYDPHKFEKLTPAELAEALRRRKDDPGPRLPVKTLMFNRCPAVAPLSVLDVGSEKRLKLDMQKIKYHLGELKEMPELINNILLAQAILDDKLQTRLLDVEQTVDEQLYDGFFEKQDKASMSMVRAADPKELSSIEVNFEDKRLRDLLPLYKARNYPEVLNPDERRNWEAYRIAKLTKGDETSRLANYFNMISEIEAKGDLTDHQLYLLEELQLYGQSILPIDD